MPKKKIPDKLQIWIEARKKYRLSHAQVQMARELGMNPKKFGSLANHKQEPWKAPLPQYIEYLYQKRFGKTKPDQVISIEERARAIEQRKEAKREEKLSKQGSESELPHSQDEKSTAMRTPTKATIEDLYHVPDNAKAEIVNGEIVLMSPTGDEPGYAGDEIFVSLREYAKRTGNGRAVSDNKGFRVHLPRRSSFSPDAAFYTGPRTGMRFFEGAPIFAVEVRSEGDYGPRAEEQMAAKRADYFAAGTQVVWDVDLLSEDVVRVYRADNPDQSTVYRRGQIAEAEPAVPGWRMPVDDLFE